MCGCMDMLLRICSVAWNPQSNLMHRWIFFCPSSYTDLDTSFQFFQFLFLFPSGFLLLDSVFYHDLFVFGILWRRGANRNTMVCKINPPKYQIFTKWNTKKRSTSKGTKTLLSKYNLSLVLADILFSLLFILFWNGLYWRQFNKLNTCLMLQWNFLTSGHWYIHHHRKPSFTTVALVSYISITGLNRAPMPIMKNKGGMLFLVLP